MYQYYQKKLSESSESELLLWVVDRIGHVGNMCCRTDKRQVMTVAAESGQPSVLRLFWGVGGKKMKMKIMMDLNLQNGQ